MSTNITHSIVEMENDELKNLVNQVKETVATDLDLSKANSKNTFAAAELWNIHKMQRRSQGSRRATLWN